MIGKGQEIPRNDWVYETLLLSVDGPVARLTMNRPDRMNSMTNRMVREAADALQRVAAEPRVRILVLTGAGRSFSPGADLQGVAAGTLDGESLAAREYIAPLLLHEMPAVTIAAINGACAGAGLGWAAACDVRVAARSARFNTAFLDVGVAGDMAGPWTLTRLIGAAKARELYLMPSKFSADDALRLGLVSRVFDDVDFAAAVEAIVERLTNAAPSALLTMKANFIDAERMSLAEYLLLESERHVNLFNLDDTREAFAAKVEGRPPRFSGG